ncbi:CTP-dependent Riboflavin kinase [Halapricum desulfuricans]|uniref:Riboflavin kinase n=2 Tax=Halapricum desulfuricans TaxID=2841257 RepID=A0A897NRQ7_9EURY|nr:CTP-dependent Riboflavin kinase [Halapricum desulfuricans]
MLIRGDAGVSGMELSGRAIGYDELRTLKTLALAGALDGESKISCSGLAGKLDVSNQTASRRLQGLEDADLLEREIVGDGQWVSITRDGESLLQREYAHYQRIFESQVGVTLTGTLTSGMSEGGHYITLPGYMRQFERKLGYEPFAGTLNVELDDGSVRARARMDALDPIEIDGWEDDERTYGPAFCYPATIEFPAGTYEQAHVIAPERTHHDDDQLELIAPEKLRERFNADDGDTLTIHVHE